jgi:hypothetical protein
MYQRYLIILQKEQIYISQHKEVNCTKYMIMILGSIIDIHSYATFFTQSLNYSACPSLLIRLSVYETQASLLGSLITFVNTFHFNLVVMFVCFVK